MSLPWAPGCPLSGPIRQNLRSTATIQPLVMYSMPLHLLTERLLYGEGAPQATWRSDYQDIATLTVRPKKMRPAKSEGAERCCVSHAGSAIIATHRLESKPVKLQMLLVHVSQCPGLSGFGHASRSPAATIAA